MSAVENVKPIISSDKALMLEHLHMLFGRAVSGRVEITGIHVAGTSPPKTAMFSLDNLEGAADYAALINEEPGRCVYVGAALRHEDTFPGKAGDDEDVLRTYALWADADNDEQVSAAKAAYRELGIDPPFVVITGREPYTRSQFWWPLETPIDDKETIRQAARGIAARLGTDRAVCTAKQIMRLAGGIAWPKPNKPGRVMERVEMVRVSRAQREFSLEQIHRACPPVERLSGNGDGIADIEVAPGGALGLSEKIVDGREKWTFQYVRAKIRELVGETGAEPSVQDLYEACLPRFLERIDQTRPGRDTSFLKQKCAEAVRSYHAGQIPGMKTLEDAVASYHERIAAGWSPAHEEQTPAPEVVAPHAAGLINATPYKWIEASKIPPRDILYGKHFFRKFLSATVSPGGLGKSSNAMVEALAMVTGRNLLGETPKERLAVWYWNGEDPDEELQRRIAAACIHYAIGEQDIAGRLFVDSGRNTEIIVAREDREGLKIAAPVVEALISTIQQNNIDVLVVDPFVASHAVSENDNTKIEAVVRQWMRVAEEGCCAVELVHHVRKPNGAAQETTVDDARGAGALLAKVRSARVLNAMSATEADEIGIDRKERFGFFRIDIGKANLTPRGGAARWRRMISVPLGNRVAALEDSVGVPVEWTKPSAFEGVTPQHMLAVRAAVEAGQWREDVRASNWVGVAVAGALGLDPEDPRAKAKIKSLLRTWIKEDVLRVVQGFDDSRRQRAFVAVGKDVE